MDWFTSHKLNKLARNANPDPKFVRALEKTLKAQLGHPLWWVQTWKWGVGAATAVTILGSGTGVYAFTSDNVLPNTPLYGVRTAIERVQESVARTPEQKAQVKAKHLERRIHENALLKKKNGEVSDDMVQDFDHRLSSLLDESSALPKEDRDQIDDQAAKLKTDYEALLEERATTTSDVERKTVTHELKEMNKKVDALEESRKAKFLKPTSKESSELESQTRETNVQESERVDIKNRPLQTEKPEVDD